MKEAAEWINFTAALRDDRAPPNSEYWNALVEGTLACQFVTPTGWEIYRARVMPLDRELDAEPLASEELGPPPPAMATLGRLNPCGVSYFYGALDRETAMAEVRPWRQCRISVARLTSASELALADLTGRFIDSKPTSRVQWLSFMIGRPVHRDDKDSYLASQHLAQKCRESGLKGILYNSSLKPGGVNVALFSHQVLSCQQIELHEVTKVSYATQQLSP